MHPKLGAEYVEVSSKQQMNARYEGFVSIPIGNPVTDYSSSSTTAMASSARAFLSAGEGHLVMSSEAF